MRSKIYEVYEVSTSLVYFVCSASPNALSVSLAADSSPKGGAWGAFLERLLPPPLGEVARRSRDGEGPPGVHNKKMEVTR